MISKVIRLGVSFLLTVLALVIFFVPRPVQAANYSFSGFSETNLANVPFPTDLGFTPDGRLVIVGQAGAVRIYQNGALVATPALDFDTFTRFCSGNEMGLLGVAIDPDFATNSYIYFYHSYDKQNNGCQTGTSGAAPRTNRVSRFVLPASNVIDSASEVVLLDNVPATCGNHNAGDLHFGVGTDRDMLYIATGDGGCELTNRNDGGGNNTDARRLDILGGKILRINKDGTIPTSNPFYNNANAVVCGNPAIGVTINPSVNVCRETWAWGLRNPFRVAPKPNSNEFYINDVGQNLWEEISISHVGEDYAWNNREGFCPNGSTSNCRTVPDAVVNNQRDPIFAYQHNTGAFASCNSLTAGVFVPTGTWSSNYDNQYLFSDYTCNKTFLLTNNAGSWTPTEFLSNETIIAMGASPATFPGGQAIYYVSHSGGGRVRRINYTGTGNRSPVAVVTASPTSGLAPLTVNFNATGSFDPDGNPITYLWNFGDGFSTQTTTPTTSRNYTANGTYFATLQIRDSLNALSDVLTVRIDVGNRAPVPQISAPTSNKLFRVGETITLTGSATDPEQGNLSANALKWRVVLHHDQHTHPFFPETVGNNLQFVTNPPEDLLAATNSYLMIYLTATDNNGLATTITQQLNPNKVAVKVETAPNGLQVQVNGTAFTSPQSIVAWEGQTLQLATTANQTNAFGQDLVFSGWSDGGALNHNVVVPATTDPYYIATFTTTDSFYHPVTPFRLYDSRNIAGNTAVLGRDGPFANGQTRKLIRWRLWRMLRLLRQTAAAM
jgi:glucose/arabinose dehydrogenase